MAFNPEVLKQVPLFSLLDDEEAAVLANQVELQRFVPIPWDTHPGNAIVDLARINPARSLVALPDVPARRPTMQKCCSI